MYSIENDLNLNQSTYTISDAPGNMVEVQDIAGNKLYYSYTDLGLVDRIEVKDASNNLLSTTTMAYDSIGRQTQLNDPNAGITTYEYNSFGMLLSQTDANQNTFNYTYDKLGRVLTATDGNTENYSYTYDQSSNGIGKLTSLVGTNGYQLHHQYDNFSRLSQWSEHIQGTPYTYSYQYNSKNQMIQETYPSGLSIRYDYDANGFFTKITKENNEPLWELTAMNEMGQITQYELGNQSVICSNVYDSDHFLQEKNAIKPGQSYIQRLAYNFDAESGNLLSRSDLLKALVENFEYDSQTERQLTSFQLGSAVPTQMQYDAKGNMIFKSDVTETGIFEYDPTKVHAVNRVVDPIELLDNQSIGYNSYNQPELIQQATHRLELFYGPDGQRRKSLRYEDQVLQSEKYFLGNYEKVVDAAGSITKEYHYISSPAGIIGVATRSNEGNFEFQYVLTDHLGSLQALVSENGTLEQEFSFDPWGNPRNPFTWQSDTTILPEFQRGFTGHEHLLEFGLINMNGRLYDPSLGRMLSPDNFVQSPGSALGFNRYTYCANNPMVYTDPSGEFVFLALVGIVAVVSGGINLGVAAYQGNVNDFWDGAYYFGVGAVVGAAATVGGAALAPVIGTGAIAGAALGAGSGFALGYANTGYATGDWGSTALTAGGWGALYGGIGGAVLGGTVAGLRGNNVWTGAPKGSGGMFSFSDVINGARYGNGPSFNFKNTENIYTRDFWKYGCNLKVQPSKPEMFLNDHVKGLDYGQQGKHIPEQYRMTGENYMGTRYVEGRSILEVNPNQILNDIHSGNYTFVQQAGRGPVVKLNYNVGTVIDRTTGSVIGSTQYVKILGNPLSGMVHFIPWIPFP